MKTPLPGDRGLQKMCDQGVQAAVHIQPRTEIWSGGRAGEEGDRRRDIFRLSVMTDSNHLTLGFCLFAVLRVHIALVGPGCTRVR